jgi:hypothetical protein
MHRWTRPRTHGCTPRPQQLGLRMKAKLTEVPSRTDLTSRARLLEFQLSSVGTIRAIRREPREIACRFKLPKTAKIVPCPRRNGMFAIGSQSRLRVRTIRSPQPGVTNQSLAIYHLPAKSRPSAHLGLLSHPSGRPSTSPDNYVTANLTNACLHRDPPSTQVVPGGEWKMPDGLSHP